MTSSTIPSTILNRPLRDLISEAIDLTCGGIEPLTTDGINRYLNKHYADWSAGDREALLQLTAAFAANMAWAYDEARTDILSAAESAVSDVRQHHASLAKAIHRRKATTAVRRRRQTLAELKAGMEQAKRGGLVLDAEE